jgi:hypothetical protein
VHVPPHRREPGVDRVQPFVYTAQRHHDRLQGRDNHVDPVPASGRDLFHSFSYIIRRISFLNFTVNILFTVLTVVVFAVKIYVYTAV